MDSFKRLKENTRIPNAHKRFVRRSSRTSFIYPNTKSFRVIDQNSDHYNFISKFKKIYSSSANKNKESFHKDFALSKSDVIVLTKNDFSENQSSKIFKLHKYKKIKIR